MTKQTTDYTEGAEPVPIGTVVEYFGSCGSGDYEITGHADPLTHPYLSDQPKGYLLTAYPDGVSYTIWPVGVERKFGNRHLSVTYVRRASFRIK
jgi:hypothetical protein